MMAVDFLVNVLEAGESDDNNLSIIWQIRKESRDSSPGLRMVYFK
jgi:hypothetical protein